MHGITNLRILGCKIIEIGIGGRYLKLVSCKIGRFVFRIEFKFFSWFVWYV